MLRRYTFWFSAAIIFQLMVGVLHALSLFIASRPANETEQQMLMLITTYRMDLGAGFSPTYANLFTAVSSCFTFLCLYAGLTNGYLLWKHTEPAVMRGIIGINVAIFGVVFLTMAFFTFLPPIVFTGLIFVNLLAAFIVIPKIESAV
ncbi:MAG: LIC_13387 family protein [Pyrinomonadaceae bacterium]